MQKSFNGLGFVNIELSSRCNKNCWMCGRRKIDRDYKEIAAKYGDMKIALVQKIAEQLPPDIVVAFHWNGDGLIYPRLPLALSFFDKQIRVLDTNGKLLVEKFDQIVDNLDTIALSIIENDPEGDSQYEIITQFLELKGDRKPLVILRLLGDVSKTDYLVPGQTFPHKKQRWLNLAEKHKCIIATRTLHDPLGSFKYKKSPTVPEIGICLELLTHLAIDRFGDVSCCVRFDPERIAVIGNVNDTPLIDIWNGEKRRQILAKHKKGKRKDVLLCDKCEFWGVPTSS